MSSNKKTLEDLFEGGTELTSLNPEVADGVGDNFQQVEQPSFCRLFCCGTNKRGCCVSCCFRCKSICERRPSSLHPLDGLRAIAVIMVVGCHSVIFSDAKVYSCLLNNWAPYLTPFANGDMGVDVFFVLSGFLIGYILLKECEAHDGDVDGWGFMRNRFIRLWPAVFAYSLLLFPVYLSMIGFPDFLMAWLPPLLFISNVTMTPTHLWTISVEFQMYILSPLFIRWAYKNGPSKTLVATIIAIVLSISAQLGILYWQADCSVTRAEDFKVWTTKCQTPWFNLIYTQTYAKIGSYMLGMYVAQLIRNDKEHNIWERIHPVVEWICFAGMIVMLYTPEYIKYPIGPQTFWINLACFSFRYAFSAFLSVLILVSMSPEPETPISWARPSKYFRGFLSFRVWLPIATLSYSIYIWHFLIIFGLAMSNKVYAEKRKQMIDLDIATDCKKITDLGLGPSIELFFGCMIQSLIFASLSYVFVEKPAIDARRVFKTKWDKLKEKESQEQQ